MRSAPGSFAPVLWILFATTGVFVIAIVTGIRLFFRRGKSVTDLYITVAVFRSVVTLPLSVTPSSWLPVT